MNDIHLLEELEQAELTRQQQHQLFNLVLDVFKRAVDARSPKHRPPGKAGLRAEKGYYRMLYLEGDFQEKVKHQGNAHPEETVFDWDFLPVILRQLKDLPELQEEITAGIEAALLAVTTPGDG